MKENKDRLIKAVNWNEPENDYVNMFWEQNIKQFWVPEEYPISDQADWVSFDQPMKDAFMKALAGLTALDTTQGHVGMPLIIDHIESLQCRSVLGFICAMENIHSRSYSYVFTSVASKDEISNAFKWVEENKHLQYKGNRIEKYYRAMKAETVTPVQLFEALSASVLLESFLFYSGFFLPLWLSGNGKMKGSGDVIKAIVRDEQVHSVFAGLLTQEAYGKIPDGEKQQAYDNLIKTIEDLLENEFAYTEHLYTEIGLSSDVKEYVKYNANKALMNMGFEPILQHGEVNQIVLNGLNSASNTTQHDFFSMKSTNYEKAINVTPVTNETFDLDLTCEI